MKADITVAIVREYCARKTERCVSARTKQPRISVVVTVLNEAPGMAALLDALRAQTLQPAEIIIVDGGSTDGTWQHIEEAARENFLLRPVRLPGANIAEGRNHGALLAATDIVACTDAGCTPQPDWLERLAAPFIADSQVQVVGGGYRTDPQTRLERVVGLLTMPGQLEPVDPLRFNPSARSVAFRKPAWQAAGGFPDWLHTAEDTLFDCQLRRLGLRFAYAPDAVVRWRPRTSLAGTWRQFRNYARGEARIGRGAGSTRFWTRRYGLCAALIVTALATAIAGGVLAACVAGGGALLLLLEPIAGRVLRVAYTTGHALDGALALVLSHWIGLARLAGHAKGRRDRRQHPEIVGRLRAYWGGDAVHSVPPWTMTHVPAPPTLIVSWHWPPVCRACTNVIATLFRHASPDAYRVVTRGLRHAPDGAGTQSSPLATVRVRWPRHDDEEVPTWTWLASIWTAARMVFAGLRCHQTQPFKRVLVIYPHRYGLLAGWLVSRLTGVPFAAYMHDLFAETLLTGSRLKSWFWMAIDERVLQSAEIVIAPTAEFAAHYRRRGITKTWVLPHCRPEGIEASPLPPDFGPLKLLYAGSIYQAHEDAVKAFYEATNDRSDINVTYLTNRNRIVPESQTQWLPPPEAKDRLRQAHACVVALGECTPYPEEVRACFPSKIVDYLAAGRPILALVPPGSFVDRFVRTTGCGVAVTRFDSGAIAAGIEQLRDPAAREQMAAAAGDIIRQLDSQRWIQLLGERLALGAPYEPCTPPFPVVEAPARRQEQVPQAEGVLQ